MGSRYERRLRDRLQERGWLVIRAAGSMGEAGDLVVLKPRSGGIAYPHCSDAIIIEVKKTKDPDVWYGSSKPEQWSDMVALCEMGFSVCYAVYHAAGSRDNRWRIHPLDINNHDRDNPAVLRREEGVNLDDYF